jgi:hypothetical protein
MAMTTYRTLRITIPYAQRLWKWAGLGCLAWLLWPTCHVRADQTHHHSWDDPLISLPHQDSLSPLAQGSSLGTGVEAVETQLALLGVKPSLTGLTELSQLASPLEIAPDPDPEISITAPGIAALESLPRHDAQALALDYGLSWGAALPVLPPSPDQTIAQVDATNGEGPDGLTSGEETDLARQSQNPVANLISVPFQNNTNVGLGQFDRTGNILNIQPVLPTPLSKDLLLINRVILPLAYQPELAPGVGNTFGLGDIFYQGFLSPVTTGNFSWGIGPAIVFPTATDRVLGTGKWSIGPAAVGIWSVDRIVAGALINNVWSFAGAGDRQDVSALTLQPFFNYNLNDGWYINTAPIVTANWQAAAGNVWTVPIGGGFGRVFAIGRQPVNLSAAAFWNVVRPEGAADWTLRLQITLLFPK